MAPATATSGTARPARRHLLALIAGAVCCVFVAACGAGTSSSSAPSSSGGGDAGASSGSGSAGSSSPGVARSQVRQDGKAMCEGVTPKQLAAQYGGDPGDATDVAHHMAVKMFKPELADVAEEGCLDALGR